MLNSFSQFGPEIIATLFLIGLLGLRARVSPRTSIFINAPPQKVYDVVSIHDGKAHKYDRTTITTELVDKARSIYRFTYSTLLVGGRARSTNALFRVAAQNPPFRFELAREGIAHLPPDNQLLKITHEIKPENLGSRLTTTYHWGPRGLLAQVLARTDLWGGAWRTKSIVETGASSDFAHQLISATVALVTGLVTLLTFAWVVGLGPALLIVFALLIHEFGHLLAYRLMGQPWGKLMFLPFLGAVAIPRLAFESQGQAVFAALMGPGLSTLLALACWFPVFWLPIVSLPEMAWLFMILGLITAALNLFNLLPVEPLDGGIALRSVLAKLLGDKARFGLLAVGMFIIVVGYGLMQPILMLFGGLAVIANIRTRKIDVGLTPLSTLETCIATFSFVAIASVHMAMLQFFIRQSHLLLPG
jgi:Zn-dependent protease